MSEIINTIEVLGDEAVIDSIIERTITEFKDDVLTEVGAYAFRGCTALEMVDLPNVTSLGKDAFTECSELVTVKCPNVTSLGANAFLNCIKLTDLNMPYLTGTLTGASFRNCKSLVSVNLPNIIGGASDSRYAFAGCESLVSISLPALKDTNYYWFQGCTALTDVDLPSLESISNQVFQGCTALTKLDLPKVKTIAYNFLQGSTSFKTLVLRSETVCTSSGTNLQSTLIAAGEGYIYVPSALIEEYKIATNWTIYADQFRALEDYTVDGTVTGELDESKI